jgi:hypothetical protein
LAFIVSNFMVVLAPHYNASWLPAFMVPGALLLTVWLLIKGVDLRKWEEKTAGDSTV